MVLVEGCYKCLFCVTLSAFCTELMQNISHISASKFLVLSSSYDIPCLLTSHSSIISVFCIYIDLACSYIFPSLGLVFFINYLCCSAVDTIIKQEALSEGQRRRTSRLYTSRVHVEDICQAIEASFNAPVPGYVSVQFSLITVILRGVGQQSELG